MFEYLTYLVVSSFAFVNLYTSIFYEGVDKDEDNDEDNDEDKE